MPGLNLARLFGFKQPKDKSKLPYWERRKDSVYYQHVFALGSYIGRDARSVIDVGSNKCPYIDWFTWIPRKVSIDVRHPYRAPGVESHQCNFFDFHPNEKFDLLLCLQTLEHISEAGEFAKKLLRISHHALITVPYKWPPEGNNPHVHDPVDEEKMRGWFGRDPDFMMISTERGGKKRLLCIYSSNDA